MTAATARPRIGGVTFELLRQWSWPEWRHHPWRQLAALVAVVLGVALAFSVQLINQSALSEFSTAVRAVNGQPDFELRAQRGGFDEALYGRVARQPEVAVASPVIELDTLAIDGHGERVPLKVIGLDALSAASVLPALLPRPGPDAGRLAMLDPDAIYLNPAARQRLGDPRQLVMQTPDGAATRSVQGSVAAGGPPLAVMDIAGVQETFGWLGRISRVDVRLRAGVDRAAFLAALHLPPDVRADTPRESEQRASSVSHAYRVNLTVLALVALFTGAFLVFSILSLSVAKRLPQFALLGVLGLSSRERARLVLVESAVLGVVGSAIGLALGTALAALALRVLAGDLGGGYFPGVAPALQFDPVAALAYGLLGMAAAMVGGWLPARLAQRLAPAQALKGLGMRDADRGHAWFGPALLLLGVPLALLPPTGDIPLAAYLSVACLLLGGIACVPAGVSALLRGVAPSRHALTLLAVERARHQRHTATIAVAGVVASLSLAVALTVMVASFRESVIQWLDTVLPADLYARAATPGNASDSVALPSALVAAARELPGVTRADSQRVTHVLLDPRRPAVALIARALPDPEQQLPLVGTLRSVPEGETAAYVSEAMVALYAANPGTHLTLPMPSGGRFTVFVRGVWRDYARQHGAVALSLDDYRRMSGDMRINDIAMWLAPGARAAEVERSLRARARSFGFDPALLEFASPGEIRAITLRIFDRSFAVTYWLQAVAIGIGLFGIAASFSAQVLARRKEFGLLLHLGLTRAQVLSIVAAEGAVWTAAGTLLGLGLGMAVSVVLVKVVNPQSFHWSMDLLLPWGRLAMLCAAVMLAGTLTAWLAARSAASRQMALAVKEDW